jgi:hypothetical protein
LQIKEEKRMNRRRRLICGFLGGVLIRLSFDFSTPLPKLACIVMAIFLISLGAISDKKLAKIKAERKREWWYEKDWSDEEEKWK